MNGKTAGSILITGLGIGVLVLWLEGGFDVFWESFKKGIGVGEPTDITAEIGPSIIENIDKAAGETIHVKRLDNHMDYVIRRIDVRGSGSKGACENGMVGIVTVETSPPHQGCARPDDLIPLGGGMASDIRANGTFGFAARTGAHIL